MESTKKEFDFKVVRIYKVETKSGLSTILAFCDIEINDSLLIKGIKLMRSERLGNFISMPQEQAKDNKWYDLVRFLEIDSKEKLLETILKAYN